MYNFLVRNGQLLAFGIGTLITIIFIVSVLSGLDGFNSLAEEEQGTTGIFNIGLYAAIGLAILCALGLIAFGVYHMATDFKNARMGLIGVGIMLVIFFVGRAMAPADVGESIQSVISEFKVSPTASKNIGGGIAATLMLLAIAAIAFIFSEIRNFFK